MYVGWRFLGSLGPFFLSLPANDVDALENRSVSVSQVRLAEDLMGEPEVAAGLSASETQAFIANFAISLTRSERGANRAWIDRLFRVHGALYDSGVQPQLRTL